MLKKNQQVKLVLEQELVLVEELLQFNIRENNWLGEGKKVGFDIEVDEESFSWNFKVILIQIMIF